MLDSKSQSEIDSGFVTDLQNIHFDKSRFRAARETKGLSQVDAARALGVSKQQLWAYENEGGRGTPSPDTLARACLLYEVDISEFTVALAEGLPTPKAPEPALA